MDVLNGDVKASTPPLLCSCDNIDDDSRISRVLAAANALLLDGDAMAMVVMSMLTWPLATSLGRDDVALFCSIYTACVSDNLRPLIRSCFHLLG